MSGPPLDNLPPGHRFADRYRVVRRLGEGHPGTVYQAVHEGLDQPVSLKVLQRVDAEPQEASRFEREAAALARLNHPSCAEVMDYGISDTAMFLALRYVTGPSLADEMSGRIAPLQALTLALDLAEGLAHAHDRGVVHRNLSPDRVVLVNDGGRRPRARMVDFGLARLKQPDLDTTAGRDPVGTPAYMAPERVRGEAGDARCDVYALGLILFEMLTGTHPFRRPTSAATLQAQLTELVPPLPEAAPGLSASPALIRLVERACAPRTDARFADGAALARALRAARLTLVHPEFRTLDLDIREGQPVVPEPLIDRLEEPTPTHAQPRVLPPAPPVEDTARGRRTGLVLAVAVGLLVLAGAGTIALVTGLWALGMLSVG